MNLLINTNRFGFTSCKHNPLKMSKRSLPRDLFLFLNHAPRQCSLPQNIRSYQHPRIPTRFQPLSYLCQWVYMWFVYLDSLFFSSDDILGLRRVLLNSLRSISRRHHGEGSRTQILHLYFTSTVVYLVLVRARAGFTLLRRPVSSDPCSTTNNMRVVYDFWLYMLLHGLHYVFFPVRIFTVLARRLRRMFLLLAVPNSPLK